MIVRRIRQHISDHNWFAVAVDFAIVVIGVFLANLVTNWNEDRQEQEQSRVYRARLSNELKDNELQYKLQSAYYRQVRIHAVRALRALKETSFDDRNFVIDVYQATQIDPTPGKRFVFDALVSAGLLRRLDAHVQEVASEYYLQMSTREPMILANPPYRDLIRQELPYEVQSIVRSKCGDQTVYFRNNIVGFRLPKDCQPALNSRDAKLAAEHIRAIAALDRTLTRYAAALDEKISLFDSAVAETVRLEKLLNAQN